VVAVLVVAAVLANVLPFQNPLKLNPGQGSKGPSWAHWFGTDKLGRDQLARLIHGSRTSLAVGILSATIAGAVGSTFGLVAGYYGKLTETLIMGWMDIMLAAPALVLVIVLTSLLGGGLFNVTLAISILSIPAFARVARAQTLAFKQRDFVKAARALGARNRRIIVKEIVPNIAPSILAYVLIVMALAIVIEGSLSFLGLGIAPEQPSWGGMISAGRGELDTAAHISLIPAFAMFLTVLSLNRLGEFVEGRSNGPRAGR
jgi:peptide/nickel transport system permease protein